MASRPTDRESLVIREVAKCFNSIARDYVSKRRRPWGQLLEPLKGAGVFLDVGSGGGRHAAYMVKQGAEGVCLDLAISMLKQARELEPRLHLVRGDMRELPFREECFDAALYIASIHHVPTKRLRLKAMAEAKRVLKPRGLLLVTAWSRWQLSMLGRMLKAWLRGSPWFFEAGDVEVPWTYRGRRYVRFYHLFTKRELRQLVEGVGLKIHLVKGFSPRPSLLPQNYVALASKEVGGHSAAEEAS
ncbi:MAG: methyltransferase domain-containing protein [Candidatus Nezhaarchaeota archaeon]|nr:methyltransferase domain-containing protein [Candidatus Nezhaarchaeota archaeon]